MLALTAFSYMLGVHERDTHAHEAKLGCEKGSSKTETEVGWQEDCEKESAQGGRRRGVVHDGKVRFDIAASSCRPDKGKSAAVLVSCEYSGTRNRVATKTANCYRLAERRPSAT